MRTIQIMLFSFILILVADNATAGSVTGLTTFTANTTAKATEVNGNFTTVQSAVNDNDSRLTTLEANPSITGNLTLPESTDANTGNIMKGTNRFLSNYGTANTFLGEDAGNFSVTGYGNTSVGYQTLQSSTSGSYNTAVGDTSLRAVTTACCNTGLGVSALNNANGADNTAVGFEATDGLTSGTGNIAIGYLAGYYLITGSNNIEIGSDAPSGDESNTIRIGGYPGTQTRAFIAGIYGITTASSTGNTVVVDSNGQLGTILSSRRFKDHIRPMGDASDVLSKLHPVTFYYRTDHDPKGRHLQYGLVAEDVAKVAPALVSYGKDGKPEGVYYRFLAPMLLNEMQTQRQVLREQAEQLKKQAATINGQARDIAALRTEATYLRKQAREVDVLKRQMARINTILAMRQGKNKVASAASMTK